MRRTLKIEKKRKIMTIAGNGFRVTVNDPIIIDREVITYEQSAQDILDEVSDGQ